MYVFSSFNYTKIIGNVESVGNLTLFRDFPGSDPTDGNIFSFKTLTSDIIIILYLLIIG